MKDITLVIMAAGLGSRYGGNKQVDGIGPHGEMLMQYSVFDAVRAGFSKIVFIVKPEHLDLVKSLGGDSIAKTVDVKYVFQDFSSLPSYFTVPEERGVKPFGTVHAVLCARDAVDGPFAVINADDYYGVDAYKTLFDELSAMPEENYATMVSYKLKNTVSKNGTVTRGVCMCQDGFLSKVTEVYKIAVFPDGTIRDTESSADGIVLDPESPVSMNMWGFTPNIFNAMDEYFDNFLRTKVPQNAKAECLLPVMVDDFIKEGKLKVSCLSTDSSWFGMTYKEDRQIVADELVKLHTSGIYPDKKLFS